ncbi:MAG: DUF2834 domain-containing protein [Alphaproteobacteria bacterium]|nr:DUF2834 domain-containing protein [Alphaproteobacteria bacterium]
MTAPARFVLVAAWVALLGEALLLSPPPRPDQWAWLFRLSTGDWAGEEPLVVALFMLMGVWPLALAGLFAADLRREPVPLWPFALGSMALGAFVLVPGLALGGRPLPMAEWQRWVGSRALAAVLLVPTLGLMAWGLWAGSPAAFAAAWRTEQFVHVMALDFCTLWLVSVVGATSRGGRGWLALVPLVGVLGYVASRE